MKNLPVRTHYITTPLCIAKYLKAEVLQFTKTGFVSLKIHSGNGEIWFGDWQQWKTGKGNNVVNCNVTSVCVCVKKTKTLHVLIGNI